ncbi:calmodulin-binding protein 60-C [Dorcoceras hygrometricum]|uniref:Calmodulin-binding protein 60-C n=1 Tax=Dorcoceras hygrometricum TaxID=472368 RepID=A0A2Z7CGI9_9LAMI|nr:calmodulin-binding protein 60-C [Dorcoceras hygrometricum]
MMNSRRICPADGSEYNDSAVGLVFMESAAGLAMETSKVESVVPASAKERSESAGTGIEKPAGEIDRRRRFQSQVTVEEADVSYYSRSCQQLPVITGLAMETSKVESAVRNQAEAKLNQRRRIKPAGTMTTSCKR